MVKAAKPVEELGNKYGRPDIERIGLFSEMPYLNGKAYVSPFAKVKAEKGKNLLAGGPKTKCDWQDCYFDKEFKRIFTGEATKGRGRKQKPSPFKNVSERPFFPTGETKLHSTPGDWYGTFQGKMDAFGGKSKPLGAFKHEGPNILTSPGKMGGCGYANICINPYPDHSVDKYGVRPKFKQYSKVLDGPMVLGMYPKQYFETNPFKEPEKFKPGPTYVPPKEKEIPVLPPGKFIPTGPGKTPGGCKAGCFEKYPEHKPDKYKAMHEILNPKKTSAGPFYPPTFGDKTFYTFSIVNENIRFRVNENNCQSYEPNYIKYLV